MGRERLCRYINRPPFALGRFRRLRDGKIAYRVKKVSRHRATESRIEERNLARHRTRRRGRRARPPHALDAASLLAAGGAELVAPNVLSLRHWERIEQGDLYATSSRIDWRTLLRRTFQVDLRTCQRWGGRLSVRAVVTEPDDIERVLASIHRSRDPPAAA